MCRYFRAISVPRIPHTSDNLASPEPARARASPREPARARTIQLLSNRRGLPGSGVAARIKAAGQRAEAVYWPSAKGKIMPGIRKHSSLDGTRTGSDCETLPSAVRASGSNRETGGSKFRRKGRDRPLVRLCVRGITNPHTILVGVLAFVATTALCFFGRAAHRRENGRRLTALQEFAADVDVPERESQPGPQTVISKPYVLVQSEVFREVQSEEWPPAPCRKRPWTHPSTSSDATT